MTSDRWQTAATRHQAAFHTFDKEAVMPNDIIIIMEEAITVRHRLPGRNSLWFSCTCEMIPSVPVINPAGTSPTTPVHLSSSGYILEMLGRGPG